MKLLNLVQFHRKPIIGFLVAFVAAEAATIVSMAKFGVTLNVVGVVLVITSLPIILGVLVPSLLLVWMSLTVSKEWLHPR